MLSVISRRVIVGIVWLLFVVCYVILNCCLLFIVSIDNANSNNLIVSRSLKGAYGEAEPLFNEAKDILAQTLGKEQLETNIKPTTNNQTAATTTAKTTTINKTKTNRTANNNKHEKQQN